ncbi:MAG: hypothetical protein HY905_14890 [Deltaproteobacteria bacterium]|nr:hypothetical protein [Deltaproteobacteria bacterium]
MRGNPMKALRAGRVGGYEDPDLVPVMNLVCVLIPLMLWVTTWFTFGEITVTRGGRGTGDNGTTDQEAKLRLVAVLTQGSITLMADRRVSADVMPEETATGTKGRVDIPHLGLTMEEIRQHSRECTPAADADFDECSYWRYLEKFVGVCHRDPAGAVKVPDLRAFNLALRGIKDRVQALFPDGMDDRDQLSVKSEDGVPYCGVVALMDFARLRRFELDWRTDEAFAAGVRDALEHGAVDPLLDPARWNDAMRRELLFPIVSFVD